MKEQLPERGRQGDRSLRRIQTNIGIVLATSTVALVVLGQRGVSSGVFADTTGMADPVGAGFLVVAAVLGLLLLNVLFVAAETSIELLRPLHYKFFRDSNQALAERIQKLMDSSTKYIASCALGSQFARLGMVFLSFALAPGVAAWLHEHGWASTYQTTLAAALIIIVPLALLNLTIEMVPKSYAELHPHRVAALLYRFVQVSSFVFALPAQLVTSVAGLFTARFGGKASFTIENQAEEEIKNLVETAEATGEIEAEERELLDSVFEFTDTVAREIMTPRVDLDAMPLRSKPEDVIRVIEDTGHSRIPLYEDTDDQIVGIIHAKDLLMAAANGQKPYSLKSLMRPAVFVPEGKNLHELLKEMRQAKTQMAVVQDEFGGTAGIVTIEDIIEELVGEIQDEYDVEEPAIISDQGTYVVGGRTHLDDINNEIGSSFESEEFETIGGYVFGLFGRQPKPGESIATDGWVFHVEETDGKRIQRLRLEQAPEIAETVAVDS